VSIVLTSFLGLSLLYGFYISGIYYEPNCNNSLFALRHAVLLVGYGFIGRESEGRKYWIIKNRYKLPKLFIFGVGRSYFSVSLTVCRSPRKYCSI
jgi:UDP-N-acetyl-D-mannosaminuronic acid transferase (WecB/TagA/CpsF family)